VQAEPLDQAAAVVAAARALVPARVALARQADCMAVAAVAVVMGRAALVRVAMALKALLSSATMLGMFTTKRSAKTLRPIIALEQRQQF
jgi:hypothetical protein